MKLVAFIQSIQLRRGSGLLTATRREGASKEEGSIVFVKGKVTEVRAGRYTGSEAFNRLTAWENCSFSFVPEQSSQPSDPEPTHTQVVERTPIATELDEPPNTQPLSSGSGRSGNNPQTPPVLFPLASGQGSPHKTRVVPRPRSIRSTGQALRMIEVAGLSRTHRRLFLLIDGNRSIDELASLVGRTPDEVTILLRDLERESIILMPHASS